MGNFGCDLGYEVAKISLGLDETHNKKMHGHLGDHKVLTERMQKLTLLSQELVKAQATGHKNVDWSQEPEKRAILDDVKTFAPQLTTGYKWSKDELKALIDNVQAETGKIPPEFQPLGTRMKVSEQDAYHVQDSCRRIVNNDDDHKKKLVQNQQK